MLLLAQFQVFIRNKNKCFKKCSSQIFINPGPLQIFRNEVYYINNPNIVIKKEKLKSMQPIHQEAALNKQFNHLISDFGRNFEIQLINAEKMYKSIGDGHDLQYLRRLLKMPQKNIPIYTLRIQNLFRIIDCQYLRQMQWMKIGFDTKCPVTEKTNVFINIYQFLQICEENHYYSKIDKMLLQQNYFDVFIQLKNSFQQIIQKIQTFKPFNQEDFNKLVKYQIRISLYMKKQFMKFIQMNLNSKGYQNFKKGLKQNQMPSFKRFITNIIANQKNEYSQNLQQMIKQIKQKNSIQSISQLIELAQKQDQNYKKRMNSILKQIQTIQQTNQNKIKQNVRHQNMKPKNNDLFK